MFLVSSDEDMATILVFGARFFILLMISAAFNSAKSISTINISISGSLDNIFAYLPDLRIAEWQYPDLSALILMTVRL